MENPEDVLQALDDFQKMRPSEIPRELEDYLCWVAKTGDPFYQWPLIKVLFREKLARVMTDFGLPSYPDEGWDFDYNIMKSSLLERLESFANAPFTIQRICELLTSPRKEYNRIDKFMRAIEKNILVVSTREPGSIARRSENGEGMVNGSVEDEVAQDKGSQASDEMEMETWVKDCGPATSLPLHSTSENDLSQISSGISQNTSVVKQLSSINGSFTETSQKMAQPTNDVENIGSTFVSSSSEFAESSSSESNASSQEPLVNISHISSVVHETNTIVGEVPEAIMNEDTSSQPSLDLEGDDSEPIDPSRKLQTTFQAKDFISSYKKEQTEEPEIQLEKPEEKETEPNSSESSIEKEQTIEEPNVVEPEVNEEINDKAQVQVEEEKEQPKDTEPDNSDAITETITEEKTEPVVSEEKDKEESATAEEKDKSELVAEEEKTQDTLECGEVLADDAPNTESQEPKVELIIEETTEDSCQTNSLVPDPIPIIEEPKEEGGEEEEEQEEPEQEAKKWEDMKVEDVTEDTTADTVVTTGKVEVIAMPNENHEDEPPKKVMLIEDTSKIDPVEEENKTTGESMDVDCDVTPPVEPMEQETTESIS